MTLTIAKPKRRNLKPFERKVFIEVWGAKCAYCEKQSGTFDIDHIVPHSRGGSSAIKNLCLSCKRCNQRKMNRRLPKFYEGLLLAIAATKVARIRNGIKWAKLQIETPSEAVFGREYVQKYLTRKAIGCTKRVTAVDLLNYEKLIRKAVSARRDKAEVLA